MSLERPHSAAGWRERGAPPAPPPTYLWEELRRSRSKGGYPWTHIDKEPLSNQLDIELLLKGHVQFITVEEDDERLETESSYERGRHSSRGRKRFRDRNRITRSRSEPDTHAMSSEMNRSEQAAASIHSAESEDFSLNDEDIPDFVMAYLQSDKGNLDEDIPDHILEYIQSRAAQLEKSQKYSRPPLPADDLFYTEDEVRIIGEARRRLEEQGEFAPPDPVLQTTADDDDMNNFDDFFARAAVDRQATEEEPPASAEQVEDTGAGLGQPLQEEEPVPTPKKGGRFLKNLSMPSKSQLKLKLPKLRTGDKKKADDEEEAQPVEGKKRKQAKQRRPQSSSPIRQKISQQFEHWNANLKRVLPKRNHQDGQVKSFVALLPGRSRSRPAKLPQPENQYEEIGQPRHETEAEEKANGSYLENEGEETMEDVENLPESEEADAGNPEIVDSEVLDALDHREFVDVEFKDHEPEREVAPEKFAGLAARGRQALELTKTKIQQSKEKLQATGNKLQSSLAKQNFAGNLEATRKKVQSTLTNTLKKRGRANKKSDVIISSEPVDEPSQVVIEQESYYDPVGAPTATARRRAAQKKEPADEAAYLEPARLDRHQECAHVERGNVEHTGDRVDEQQQQDYEEEQDEEVEIEPRMEFTLYNSDRPAPESVDQSTETLPEDVEEEKENVVMRPSRRRFSSKKRDASGEVRQRPHSMHCESSTIGSAWPGARPKQPVHYPAVSQEILAAFATPINALDAVDPWRSTPPKPPRSRSKRNLHTMSDLHLYSNVAPPRRMMKQADWSTGTWPRKSPSVEYPTAPRRAKPKPKHEQPDASAMQTWPRRRRNAPKTPPAAPKRTRSKRKLDGEENAEDLIKRSNILTDPDILFGADSRYIDDEEMNKRAPPLPDLNQLSEADVLFGAESRFIDDDSSSRSNGPVAAPVQQVEQVVTEQAQMAEPEVTIDALEEIHQQIIPTLRSRKKSILKKENCESASRAPSAPLRRKHSIKSQSNEDRYATLSKARKEPPVPVPMSTPPEDPVRQAVESSDGAAGIDKILEILATFPQEREVVQPKVAPRISEESRKENEENQYSEINQETRKTPPPRPPPPTYGPESADSYSYIYTVPRRKKHERSSKPSASPERPPRTYCTIRPHRPPRRTRAATEAAVMAASTANLTSEQRAPALSTETRTRSFSMSDKEARHLQSAPVIERMRARPLPPPPRVKRLESRSPPPPKPPRGPSSTLRKRKDARSLDNQQQQPVQPIVAVPAEVQQSLAPERVHDPVPIVVVTHDGYEPVEDPPIDQIAQPVTDSVVQPTAEIQAVIDSAVHQVTERVEEISIGIQTDPQADYEESQVEESREESMYCDQSSHHLPEHHDTQRREVDSEPETRELSRPKRLPLNNLSFDKMDEDEVKPLSFTNIQQIAREECRGEETSKISNVDETPRKEKTPESKTESEPVRDECPAEKDTRTSADEVNRPARRRQHRDDDDDEDESDSFSRIPESFARLTAPVIPPLRVELPTRLQLTELNVERLNVREVTADRLVVSSVDTNSLQVCQMATSNAAGQLVFNLGPGVTLPPLLLASNEEEAPETPKRINKSKSKGKAAEQEEAPQSEEPHVAQPEAVQTIQAEAAVPAPVQVAPVAQVSPLDAAVAAAPAVPAVTPVPLPIIGQATVEVAPTNAQAAALATGSSLEEADIADLALRLAAVSARRLGSTAVTAATETYSIAQRVAELGWQQLNDHLQRQGIYFDDKERENVKTVLLMLLLIISAIFLLGPGRTRSINHWDFYFPN